MYSGTNNNKATSLMDNTITVTPIKMEVEMPHVYPTTSGTTSISVTTSAASRRMSNALGGNVTSTSASSTNAIGTGATPKDKTTKPARLTAHKTPPTIDNFWTNILNDVKGIQQVDAKHQALPLARIKKIMKLDENAKMIAAEAPLLFAKACDYFIQELTMRAWVHTEENKRRTLQRSDIAQAIANYDQFDFLIDIVPREDIKPSTSSSSSNSQNAKKDTQTPSTTTTAATATASVPTTTMKVETQQMVAYGTLTTDQLAAAASAAQQQVQPTQQLQILQQPTSQAHPQQLQYFITIPGQQHGQHQLVQQLQLQQPQLQQQLPNGLTLTTSNNPQLAGLNIVAPQPQQLILTAGPNGQLTATPAPAAPSAQQQQQTALLQNLAQAQQQQQMGNQQQIQLLQQVVTPNGELTNVPITITANQLNLLRLQMQQQQQQQQAQQQVIIPAHCVGGGQQMVQIGTGGLTATTSGSNPNSNTTTQLGQIQIHHHQPQQQQQQQQHQQGQQQQQQHNTSGNTNIFLSTGQQQNSNSVVSTDRNLGSTFRTNC